MRVVVIGGSGFIGKRLISFLKEKGEDVIVAHRNTPLPKGDVVVNLAGEPIIGRWTASKKRKIKQSRIDLTKKIASQLQESPPELYIGASAIGFYGDRGDEILTEESSPGENFLAEVCREWEESSLIIPCRVVHARFGIVFGKEGGALKKMVTPFKLGLGGPFGNGRQWISWIAIEDLVSALYFLMKNKNCSGAYNFTSPHPVTNETLTGTLAQALHRPAFFRIPSFAMKLLLGEASEMFLGSTRALPAKLESTDFQFQHSDLKNYLTALFK
jgi:uncharacterized protein (TIGR01777 family)